MERVYGDYSDPLVLLTMTPIRSAREVIDTTSSRFLRSTRLLFLGHFAYIGGAGAIVGSGYIALYSEWDVAIKAASAIVAFVVLFGAIALESWPRRQEPSAQVTRLISEFDGRPSVRIGSLNYGLRPATIIAVANDLGYAFNSSWSSRRFGHYLDFHIPTQPPFARN
jgi:hypothetical protein